MAGYFWDQLYVDKMKRNRKIKFRVVRSNDQNNNRLETRDRDLMIAINRRNNSIRPISIDRSIDRNEAEGKGREATPFARSDLG